jgi:hypothetical protein
MDLIRMLRAWQKLDAPHRKIILHDRELVGELSSVRSEDGMGLA